MHDIFLFAVYKAEEHLAINVYLFVSEDTDFKGQMIVVAIYFIIGLHGL